LSFTLPEGSNFYRRGLITDTPFDIILSHDNIYKTGLGLHIVLLKILNHVHNIEMERPTVVIIAC